jgi:hypothetical protein
MLMEGQTMRARGLRKENAATEGDKATVRIGAEDPAVSAHTLKTP